MKFLVIVFSLLCFSSTAIAGDAGEKNNLLFDIKVKISANIIKLTLAPKKGYKLSNDYNSKLTLQNGKLITFSKLRFSKLGGDFKVEGKNQTINIPFTRLQKGKENIFGTLSCVICNEIICKPFRKTKISFNVD